MLVELSFTPLELKILCEKKSSGGRHDQGA